MDKNGKQSLDKQVVVGGVKSSGMFIGAAAGKPLGFVKAIGRRLAGVPAWFMKLSKRGRAVAAAVALLVVGGAVTGGVLWWQYAHSYKAPPPTAKFTNGSLVDQVNQLEKEGRYSDALKLLNSQAVKNNYKATGEQTAQSAAAVSEQNVIALIAGNYVAQKNYTAAVQQYQLMAKKYGMNAGLAITLAQLEMHLHNTKAAKDYYNQALTLLKSAPQIQPVKDQTQSIQAILAGLK